MDALIKKRVYTRKKNGCQLKAMSGPYLGLSVLRLGLKLGLTLTLTLNNPNLTLILTLKQYSLKKGRPLPWPRSRVLLTVDTQEKHCLLRFFPTNVKVSRH